MVCLNDVMPPLLPQMVGTWNNFNCITQSHCRKYLVRLHYMKLKKAAITTQCAWRGKVARRELRKLKMVNFL